MGNQQASGATNEPRSVSARMVSDGVSIDAATTHSAVESAAYFAALQASREIARQIKELFPSDYHIEQEATRDSSTGSTATKRKKSIRNITSRGSKEGTGKKSATGTQRAKDTVLVIVKEIDERAERPSASKIRREDRTVLHNALHGGYREDSSTRASWTLEEVQRHSFELQKLYIAYTIHEKEYQELLRLEVGYAAFVAGIVTCMWYLLATLMAHHRAHLASNMVLTPIETNALGPSPRDDMMMVMTPTSLALDILLGEVAPAVIFGVLLFVGLPLLVSAWRLFSWVVHVPAGLMGWFREDIEFVTVKVDISPDHVTGKLVKELVSTDAPSLRVAQHSTRTDSEFYKIESIESRFEKMQTVQIGSFGIINRWAFRMFGLGKRLDNLDSSAVTLVNELDQMMHKWLKVGEEAKVKRNESWWELVQRLVSGCFNVGASVESISPLTESLFSKLVRWEQANTWFLTLSIVKSTGTEISSDGGIFRSKSPVYEGTTIVSYKLKRIDGSIITSDIVMVTARKKATLNNSKPAKYEYIVDTEARRL